MLVLLHIYIFYSSFFFFLQRGVITLHLLVTKVQNTVIVSERLHIFYVIGISLTSLNVSTLAPDSHWPYSSCVGVFLPPVKTWLNKIYTGDKLFYNIDRIANKEILGFQFKYFYCKITTFNWLWLLLKCSFKE